MNKKEALVIINDFMKQLDTLYNEFAEFEGSLIDEAIALDPSEDLSSEIDEISPLYLIDELANSKIHKLKDLISERFE